MARSTTEAEYITCSEASREARWLRKLQRDTGDTPTTDEPDGAEATGQLPRPDLYRLPDALAHIIVGISKARTKHIDVWYHNSRNLHQRRVVKYDYVNTNDNPADILTEALPREKHEKFARAMGVW